MATTRINAVSATATTFAGDDFLPIDGNVNATRRILVTSLFASASAIGSVTPAAGTFTSLSGTNINGTLGATTPSSVAATTGGFSGVLDVGAGGFTQGGYGLLNINGSSGGMVKFGTATVLKGSIYGNVGGITYDTVGALVHNFYTNSVSRGTITDTGLNGMAIGATTPSTIAATTATASGNVAIGAAGQALRTINLDVTASGTNDSAAMSIAKKGTGFATLSMVTQGRAAGWDINYNFPATGDLSFTTLATSATVATLTSTGLNSTAIGATTPSTGAFTTVSATGAISSSGSQTNNIGAGGTGTGISQITLNGGTGTNGGSNIAFNKNSLGKAIVGIDSCITGGTTDNLMNYVASGGTIRNYIGSTGDIAIFSATGAAITGTLSATGVITGSNLLRLATCAPSFPASGTGLEIYYETSTDRGVFLSYDRTGSAYKPIIYIAGTSHTFSIAGSTVAAVSSTGLAVTGIITASNGTYNRFATANSGDTVASLVNKGSASAYLTIASGTTADYVFEMASERTGASTGNFYFGGNHTTNFVWRSNGYANLGNWNSTALSVTGALTATGAISTAATGAALTLNSGDAATDTYMLLKRGSGTSWAIAHDSQGGLSFAKNLTDKAYFGRSGVDGLTVTGILSCTGALAIGNTVNTVTATSPNRTITMVIGGTTYYIHAKTTND